MGDGHIGGGGGEGVVYRRVGGEGEGVKPCAHTMPLGFQTSFVR